MNHVGYKVLNKNDPGSDEEIGADDYDKIARTLNGDAEVDTPTIKSSWTFRNAKCYFSNPLESFKYRILVPAITNNYDLTWPTVTANDTILAANSTIEIKNKTIDAKLNTIKNIVTFPSAKKWGAAFCTLTTETGTGMLDGYTKVTTPTAQLASTGSYLRYDTGTSANTTAGMKTSQNIFERDLNPRIKCRMSTNSQTTNLRFYFGFSSATSLPATDTPLGSSDHGFLIGIPTSDNSFRIYSNDGSGAAPGSFDTGVSGGGTVHTLEVQADETLDLFRWTIDDGAATGTTSSRIPSATQDLKLHCIIQNSTTSARQLDLRYVETEADK